jgi:hypothetical protein
LASTASSPRVSVTLLSCLGLLIGLTAIPAVVV